MKSLIAILFAMPVLAFGTTCYEATTPTYNKVPARFCLDALVESTTANELLAITYDNFPPVLEVTETLRHNEDRVNFTAKAVIVDEWQSGCGDGFKATLIVKSEFLYGQINPAYMDLSVEIYQTNDTCHSHPQTEFIKYVLVK